MSLTRGELLKKKGSLIALGTKLLNRERDTRFEEIESYRNSARYLAAEFGPGGERILSALDGISFEAPAPELRPNELLGNQERLYTTLQEIAQLVGDLKFSDSYAAAFVPRAPVQNEKVRKPPKLRSGDRERKIAYARVLAANPKFHGLRFYQELERAGVRPRPEWLQEGCPRTYPVAHKDPDWSTRICNEKCTMQKLRKKGVFEF